MKYNSKILSKGWKGTEARVYERERYVDDNRAKIIQ